MVFSETTRDGSLLHLGVLRLVGLVLIFAFAGLKTSPGKSLGGRVVDADAASTPRLDDGRVDLVKTLLLWDASAPSEAYGRVEY